MLISTNPHHFLTTCTWDVLNVNANRVKSFLRNIQECLNHVLLLRQLQNYQGGKASRKDGGLVLRHGRTCSKMRWGIRRAGKQKVEQLHKVSSPWLDDHQFKPEALESVGEFSKVRPDNLWSVNKLARAVTHWTQACDRRLARLISYIHHTNEFRRYCHVGNTSQHCRLGLFQDSDFAGDLEDSQSPSGGVLCTFGSRTFISISWMCKKQTSVTHSSTASEIISLDAGLRMDGLLALDLWDVVIEVLRSTNNTCKIKQTSPRKLVRDRRSFKQ